MKQPLQLGLAPGTVVSIPVRDVRKSSAWYQETFGFGVARALDEPAWCELTTKTDGLRIGLAQVQQAEPGDTTPIFTVQDIERAAAELDSRHIATSEIVTVEGHARLITLQDPDGNTLMLQEEL